MRVVLVDCCWDSMIDENYRCFEYALVYTCGVVYGDELENVSAKVYLVNLQDIVMSLTTKT